MTTLEPTQIFILGGSGDLAKRKLIPALLDLYVHNKLPKEFTITGLARTPRTDEEYRSFVTESINKHQHGHTEEQITGFCEHISYISGSFDDIESYTQIQKATDDFMRTQSTCTNRLYYLAVPPQYYQTIFTHLHSHKLMKDCDDGSGWARVLVEKPFGKDLESAKKLDAKMSSLFKEKQIFRIDHYLAKEAVQNILSFRFANTLLRSVWNKEHVKEVRITMHEDIDVGTRGHFYDEVGTLRDVGQNHLLQLLALIAMKEPATFSATDIRKQRAAILKKLKPIPKSQIENQVVRAQYENYKETEGVSVSSETETFFALTAYIADKNWKGVPFHIEAGKGMKERKVEIEVIFKDVQTGPFEKEGCVTKENKVILRLSPKQTMEIVLNAKKPGHSYTLEERTLSFGCDSKGTEIDAYEKVLLDCIEGDQTLFTKTDEVLASWQFITPILNHWSDIPLHTYPIGSSNVINH